MQTTLEFGQKKNSAMQEMGEVREPMSRDCWADAQQLAEKYSKKLKHDFWVLFAAKPHVERKNVIVCGWEVIAKKPPAAMVGVLVFKWDHRERRLLPESDLCLPYDVPVSEAEMSKKSSDVIISIADAARKSHSILLA